MLIRDMLRHPFELERNLERIHEGFLTAELGENSHCSYSFVAYAASEYQSTQ